jgi:preprotein translocase subunit SecG
MNMEWFKPLITVVQFLSALGIIGLVLIQHGKGADMGAAFGSGSSGSLFGATGSANFLSRSTAVLAALFFVSTLGLTFLGSRKFEASQGLLGSAAAVAASQTPSVANAASAVAPDSHSSLPIPVAPADPAGHDVPQ